MGATVEGIEVTWDRVRDLFSLEPTVAHLNHGSFGAVPVPVQRAQLRLRDEMDANPVAFFTRGLSERIRNTRRQIASFLGAEPEGTALVANATTATQIVLGSLQVDSGDEIIVTDHGYGAVRLAVERLCRRAGAVVREISIPLGADDDETVATIAAGARAGRARLAIVDQVSSPTAKLFPVDRIAAALRDTGVPTLVDAAHVPGMLAVDVASISADFWLGNLHKWAFAPRPTAVLVVAPQHRTEIEPLVVSCEHGSGFPASVEFGGTLDYTGWLAAPTGLRMLDALGPTTVRRHNEQLATYGQNALAAALGLDPQTLPRPTPGRGLVGGGGIEAQAPVSMRLVPLPPGIADHRDAAVALRRRIAADLGCEVAINAWQPGVRQGRGGFVRLSAQVYNRIEEYDRLATALPDLLTRMRTRRAVPSA